MQAGVRNMKTLVVGDEIGRLTVKEITRAGAGWRVELTCSCGKLVNIPAWKLAGRRSCGCLRNDNKAVGRKISSSRRELFQTKGASVTRPVEYRTWRNMISRCNTPHHPMYPEYGGRGIVVCERWLMSFAAFLEDMGCRLGDHLSIERVNNADGYHPGNCIWGTHKQQARNTRRTRKITFLGETKCLEEWAKSRGMSSTNLARRIDEWGPDLALSIGKIEYRGTACKTAILTEEIVREVRRLRALGYRYKQIAEMVGATECAVQQAGSGRSWKHVV